MIDIKIMGGLGNQMFQWACARNFQELYGHHLRYDLSFYESQDSGGALCRREFLLKKFPNIKFNTKPEQAHGPYRTNIVDYFDFDKFTKPKDKHLWYVMMGYWQSEKYFKENEEIIRKELDIGDEIKYNIEKKNNWLGSENTVSLHVRRTDYVTSNGVHPVQPISYYHQALDLVQHDRVLVFSDDIDWCKQNLNFKNVSFSENNSEIEDMYLMSMCHNNIIANSSFSWWGAYLNKNKSKKVVAPSLWFGNKNMNDKDIIPETWIKI